MYTKTKLRRKQDPNKFEPIYTELENIYQNNFKETERKLHKEDILIYYSILNYVDLLITEIDKIVDESNIYS